MAKKLHFFYFILLISVVSFGAPSDAKPIRLLQLDGTFIDIYQHGDEFFHWASTIDGYTLLPNENNVYEYAISDESGDLVLSGIKARSTEERQGGEIRFINSIHPQLKFSKRQIKTTFSTGTYRSAPIKRGGFPTTGENNLIMILVKFSDTENTYTQENFNDFMNTEGGTSGNGSFKDYYLEDSYGLLDITTTVTAWVTLPNERSYYAEKGPAFAYDAIKAADALGIDFSEFDNDMDGEVDGIALIHTGRGQEASGDTDDIWSHSWGVSAGGFSTSQRTFDGVVVDAYTVQPEKYGAGITTIGVMCHEFGHNLGAPDYYDTNYDTDGSYVGTGSWDIMAGGSWNGSPSGSSPAHTNMYQKIVNTWVSPTVISTNGEFTLNHSGLNQEAYLYYSAVDNEYFLLENRQKYGFDRFLPGHGLIIYHVDDLYINNHNYNNTVNASSHQGIYPKAASGSINSSGCPFPGSGQKTKFDDTTNPNSLSWEGEYSLKPMYDISETDSVVSFYIAGAGLDNPRWETVVEGTDYLELNWSTNQNDDDVILLWSYGQGFPTLDQGEEYEAGHVFMNGAEILYVGNDVQQYVHENLAPGEVQNYKLISTSNGLHSPGRLLDGQVKCQSIYSMPVVEDFELYSPYGPGECWQVMRNTYANGGLSGDNLRKVDPSSDEISWYINTPNNPDKYNVDLVFDGGQSLVVSSEATDLQWFISPDIHLSGGYANMEFYMHYEAYGDDGYKYTKFHVLVYANDEWNALRTWSGEDNNLYDDRVKLLLDDYLNHNIKIAFVYEATNAYSLALDNILISGGTGERLYDIDFVAIHEEEAVEGVEVFFNEQQEFTNDNGYSYFRNVPAGEDVVFVAKKEGYNDYEGVITIDQDVEIVLSMHPLSITVDPFVAVSVYPNPVKSEFILVNENESEGDYLIYNLAGQQVLAGSFNGKETIINSAFLSDGVYVLKISSNNSLQNIKIVK